MNCQLTWKRLLLRRFNFRLVFSIIQLDFLFGKIIYSQSVPGWQGSSVLWKSLIAFHAEPPHTVEPPFASLYTVSAVSLRSFHLSLLTQCSPSPVPYGNLPSRLLFPVHNSGWNISASTFDLSPFHSPHRSWTHPLWKDTAHMPFCTTPQHVLIMEHPLNILPVPCQISTTVFYGTSNSASSCFASSSTASVSVFNSLWLLEPVHPHNMLPTISVTNSVLINFFLIIIFSSCVLLIDYISNLLH